MKDEQNRAKEYLENHKEARPIKQISSGDYTGEYFVIPQVLTDYAKPYQDMLNRVLIHVDLDDVNPALKKQIEELLNND